MSLLDDLLKANDGAARPLSAKKTPKLCVVACDDARLTGQLGEVLGLASGGVVLVRIPGAGGGMPDALVQQVIAKAVYVEGCQEVVLVSHTDCSLEGITDAQIRDRMGEWGVLPDDLPLPVRDAVGAGRGPREALRALAERLGTAALLPRRLPIHVVHLDEETGRLAVVQNGSASEAKRREGSSLTVAPWATPPAAATSVGSLADSLAREVIRSAESAATAARSGKVDASAARVMAAPPPPGAKSTEAQSADQFTQSLLAGTDSILASTLGTSSLGSSSSRARSSSSARARPASTERPPSSASAQPARPSAPAASEPAPPPWLVSDQPTRPPQAAARPAPARAARPAPPAAPQRSVPATRNVALSTETQEAIDRLSDFIGAEFRMMERQLLLENVEGAYEEGRSGAQLAQVVVEAIIALGDARYRVMNTLVHFREGLSKMPPAQAIELLRKMIR